MDSKLVLPIKDSYVGILAMLGTAVFLVPHLAANVAHLLAPTGFGMQQAVGLLCQQVLFALLALWHLRINLRLSGKDFGLNMRPSLQKAGLIGATLVVLDGLGLWVARLSAAILLGQGRALAIFHKEESGLMSLFRYESPSVVILLIIAVTVVTPVAEELLFRGYLYAALKSKVGSHAIWVSSVIFTLMHFYIIHALPVFLVALGLVWLYEKRGALFENMVAHATLNGVIVILLLWQRHLGS